MKGVLGALCVLIVAGMAHANVADSLRPIPREPIVQQQAAPAPDRATLVTSSVSRLAPGASLRPLQRSQASQGAPRRNTFGKQLKQAFQKKPRAAKAPAAKTPKGSARVARGLQGSVCGDPSIRGEQISRIPGKINGCGLNNGVKVTEVSGVGLTQHARIDCNTAKALKSWVENGVKPAVMMGPR